MAINLNKRTKDELMQDILCERVNVNDLNLAIENQREAFFAAIQERPFILTKIKGENSNHFLLPAVEKDPVNFIYLKKEQYNDDIAQIYLAYRLSVRQEGRENFEAEESADKNNKWFSIHNSIDGKIVLNYNYATPNGEELYYFDNELQIPISIKSNFKISLKIKSAATFIEKLDMHASQLGKNRIENVVENILENQFRTILTAYIDRNKIGYYTLCASIGSFETELQNKLKAVYAPYGIEVSSVLIRKFAIPSSIQEKIEDQAFELRQAKAEMYAQHELAKKSLENYEIKLAIENRYPNAERSLTEYEKDMALKRFMIKNGLISKETIDRNITIKRKFEENDKIIEKEQDGVMYIPKKKNSFKRGFFGWFITFIIANLALCAYNLKYGILFAAFNVFFFGLIAIANAGKFKSPKQVYKTKKQKEEELAAAAAKVEAAQAKAEAAQAKADAAQAKAEAAQAKVVEVPVQETTQEEAAATKDE